jgi:hypothetical protein
VIWIMVLHKITHAFWTRGSYHFQEYNGWVKLHFVIKFTIVA